MTGERGAMNCSAGRVPSVSVIMVNHNAQGLLADCALLALRSADQVIVVDNASSDDSLARLELICGTENHLEVIKNSSNLGFAAACNIGMEKATGEYLLFLNPDCYLNDEAVSNLICTLEVNPEAGMACSLLVNPDGSEQRGARRAIPTPWRSLLRASGLSILGDRWPRLFFDFDLYKQPLPNSPIEVEAVSGACMMVKSSAVRNVGIWDEKYFLHCEDLDWCMRFRQKGWKILFVPNARAVHYQGACSKSRPIFVEWHKHKGMVRFYRKFFRHQYPLGLMWLVTLGVWLRFAGLAGRHLIMGISFNEQNMAAQVGAMKGEIPSSVEVQSPQEREIQAGANVMHVGVLGASSMVGKALVPMLSGAGRFVHAFSRKRHTEKGAGVAWHELPLRSADAIHMELPHIEEWVCLAPIKALMERLDWLEAYGAKRVVALSSTSRFTKTNSSDPAEQALVKHLIESEEHLAQWAESRGIEWVVLRPTLVYGYGLDRNISLIAGFIRRFGFFPTFGKALGLRQPVHADDVAYACIASLQRTDVANHAYNISGAEQLSYREMVERIFAALGRRPHFITIPLWMFALAMNMLKIIPRFSKISPAMAERMNQDMVFEHEEAARDLGFAPRPFELTRQDMPE